MTEYPPLRQGYYAVFVLMIITLTATLDRYLPFIAVEPIKAELGLTDTGVSLIQGASFSIFYCIAGFSIGRLVDFHNRRNILILGVFLWSALSIWTGLAQSFGEMLIARAGVGVAEAVVTPASYSIIADCFPPRQRGRAIGIYFVSLIVGGAGSFIIGGALMAQLAVTPLTFPVVGVLPPWRGTFVLVALLGLPAIVAGLTLREPKRQDALSDNTAERLPFMPFVQANPRAIYGLYTTFGLLALISVIPVSWAPTLYVRKFGIPLPEAAMTVGVALLAGGILASLSAGLASDYWARSGGSGRLRIQIASLIVSTPILILLPLISNVTLSYALVLLSSITLSFGTSAVAATMQDIAPNRLRGRLLALNGIVLLICSATSPTLVAMVSDIVFRDPNAVDKSMAIVAAVFGCGGISAALLTAKHYAQLRTRSTS